jgi:hypothetical protein
MAVLPSPSGEADCKEDVGKEQAVRTRQTITIVSLWILWVGVVPCPAAQDVPALKDVFRGDFLIGGALIDPW